MLPSIDPILITICLDRLRGVNLTAVRSGPCKPAAVASTDCTRGLSFATAVDSTAFNFA